jgi:hypothetical protein|tara:strand:- start:132 stop:461 length:330 start_codon:yes stop_codon:yes gene_type:complete
MFNDFSKYDDNELLVHIETAQTKLFSANPNYPAYQQLQSYIEDARFEYGERIQMEAHRKDLEEGDEIIEIGQGEMKVDPDPIPEEEKEEMRLTAVTKLLAQSYVYDTKK